MKKSQMIIFYENIAYFNSKLHLSMVEICTSHFELYTIKYETIGFIYF